jgi:hypothetical protein
MVCPQAFWAHLTDANPSPEVSLSPTKSMLGLLP